MTKGLWTTVLLSVVLSTGLNAAVVSHDFEIVLDPNDSTITVIDHLEVSEDLVASDGSVTFSLNRVFAPLVGGLPLEMLADDNERPGTQNYRRVVDASRRFSLHYTGRLSNEDRPDTGHISPEGVYLSGSAAWYPEFEGALHRFRMRVEVPPGWQVVSQGAGNFDSEGMQWVESWPQDDIYLIAGAWSVFTRISPIAEAQVYLRENDPVLAEGYLNATQQYLALYENLLGAYPYTKFALVENFWETGYGMPSFTLLGSRVIRLPFIVHTSYPHEILHNWWGNGVYVDYDNGNWSEGLTAYLADHLLRERHAMGADYRRDALQKYRSHVTQAKDFPLRNFVGKHGEASAAVGYGKTLMFFHMLRRRLGDKMFVAGLRAFYAEHRFRRAGYDDLRTAFENVSGQNLELMFSQWTQRSGAPVLSLEILTMSAQETGFRVAGRLRQTQHGVPYELDVPLVVHTSKGVRELVLRLDSKALDFSVDLQSPAFRVAVDPRFDVFRRLDTSELPVSLDELLAAEDSVALIPSGAKPATRDAYRTLAKALGADVIELDESTGVVAHNSVVWVFGWENRHLNTLSVLLDGTGELTNNRARFDEQTFLRDEVCSVLVLRRQARTPPIAFVGCDSAQVLMSLSHRLTHYGKYSYLGFDAESAQNIVKGKWVIKDSTMNVSLSADAPPLDLPVRPPLSDFPLDL